MRIGIDFDGVINNMLETWVEWLNKEHGCSVKVEEVTDWELHKQYSNLSSTELFAPLFTPEFWDEVTIKKDAQEVIERLMNDGHEIYIVTSSHYKTLPYKLKKCLFAHFPRLTEENVIITYNKALIRCDLLVDDRLQNLVDYPGGRVLFDAPYNKGPEADAMVDYRVASWKELYMLVAGLAKRAMTPPARVKLFKAPRGGGKTAWLHQMIKETPDQIPCYVVASEQMYHNFCRLYFERFGERCRAKLYRYPDTHLESAARIFIDTPSDFEFTSSTFDTFRRVFLDREHLIYIADSEEANWYAIPCYNIFRGDDNK
jgi:5'(3')-deoxyribonucleotidase